MPPKLSSFAAPNPASNPSSLASRKPLHATHASSTSQPSARPPTAAALAQQVHDWLRDEQHSLAARQQSPLPSVACLKSTIRNQPAAQLLHFLVQVDCHKSHKRPTPTASSSSPDPASSLSAVREQLNATLASTDSDIEQKQAEVQQLHGAIQQQHRQLKQQQADEQKRRRRLLLTQAAIDQLTSKLSRLQQWTSSAEHSLTNHTAPPLTALGVSTTGQLQRLCRSIDEAERKQNEVESMRSVQPLLVALRQRHIQLAMETQRLMREAREYECKIAELPSSSAVASMLPLLHSDIAAHQVLLQHVEWLQAGDDRQRASETRVTLHKDAQEVTKLKQDVSQRWVRVAALQRSRQQMRQARQPYFDELQYDHQQHIQPLLASLKTALTEKHSLMTAEWQQLRDLPFSVTHRVSVQTDIGSNSTFLLPASSSSLQAITAPWPMLRPVLDAMVASWYQSAHTLLPSLVAHHTQHRVTQSATRHHGQQLLSTLQSHRVLPNFSSLLASSAAIDATHAASTATLHTLHTSLSSQTHLAAHLSMLLQTQLRCGSLHLLPSLRVDGRDGSVWMEQLSGLEAKCERQQQRAQERKEAQLREAQKRSGVADAAVERKHRYSDDNYNKQPVRK